MRGALYLIVLSNVKRSFPIVFINDVNMNGYQIAGGFSVFPSGPLDRGTPLTQTLQKSPHL